MSNLFLGIPHSKISKKVPINMGPKMNRFRYRIYVEIRIAIKTAELPLHIIYDSHVTAVASYTQVFIVHA